MYDKQNDVLNFYKWKCGYENSDGSVCPVKFLDKPSLILHLLIIHGYRANDLRLPMTAQQAKIRSIQMTRKGD